MTNPEIPTHSTKNHSSDKHLEEFQPYLNEIDIPEDQKREFLALLWSIMVEFVNLGFGVDAASQAIAAQISVTESEGQTDAQLALSFDAANQDQSIEDKEVEYE
ncbi:MAG: hypothetical protein AAGA97_00700 [Pseudomonadota bacterium]